MKLRQGWEIVKLSRHGNEVDFYSYSTCWYCARVEYIKDEGYYYSIYEPQIISKNDEGFSDEMREADYGTRATLSAAMISAENKLKKLILKKAKELAKCAKEI
jgi:hypothetical protein